MEGNVEFEVRESDIADLSVYVSDPGRDFHWRWDVMSIGRMAAGILSKQLFMPMVTLATVISSLGQPADEVSEETLRTLAERKASTAKVMPAHHLRGFFSRPAVQTTMKCIAHVDAAPNLSNYESSNAQLVPAPSIDMVDPPHTRDAELGFRHSTSSSGDRSDPTKASRRGKGRDDTDDEDDGSVRKIRRGATPRRSAAGIAESSTVRRDLFTRPRYDPDSTTTEAETTRDMSTRAGNSQTMDEDHLEPSSQPPPHVPSLRHAPTRPSPRDKLPRSSPPPLDNSDVFGATQNETQTQASSDDSDREAELERRVRAAGMIGSAAVRTPAGGGLGARMIRKKF